MARKGFRAIIVGGGVGGLTLANTFEKLGIDYVLLESYRDFAPQVGASIAMLPAGQRILDQLGCRDPFLDGVASLDTNKPTVGGKPILIFRGYNSTLVQRLGQGLTFNDRQILLRVLHDNIEDKSKLLLNKRVAKVSTTAASATVETTEGEVFEADIVVGVDGIRSVVRAEMWRNAAETAPHYFPKEEMKRVPIDFKCVYGISRPHKAIAAGVAVTVIQKGCSYLIIGGPGGRVYFFLFERLPERICGHQAPRYSKDEAKALAEAHADDRVLGDLTFGQLFAGNISFGMTPLHEHVFEKWHFGRIMTLGDAAHKPNPISGHGGNGAMESVVELANQLKRRLDASDGTLSAEDIASAFGDTQATRFERAKRFVEFSHGIQEFNAPKNFFASQMTKLAPLLLTQETLQEENVGMAVDAVRVEGLPVPFRPHFVPWTDELPAKPIKGSWLPRTAVALALVGIFFLAEYGLPELGEIPDSFLGHSFRETFTGYGPVDTILSFLTKVFSLIVASPNPEHRLQLIYFLPMLTPMVLIWMVEAHRLGNLQSLAGRLVTWPGIFAVAYQLLAIARIAPIYFLVTLFISRAGIYHRVTSRAVDVDVARALLPAVGLGFVLPTVFMLLPLWSNPTAWLDFTTIWQLAPVAVGPLTTFLASIIHSRRLESSPKAKAVAAAAAVEQDRDADLDGNAPIVGSIGNTELYENKDLPHLLNAYATVSYAAAALHVSVMVYLAVASSPTLSFRTTFLDLPCWPWGAAGLTWHAGLDARALASVIFRWDLVCYALALLVWCLHTVSEMRRLGYVRTADALRAAAAVAASFVLVGPGAMYAGTWYWREKTIAGLSKMDVKEHVKEE